MVSRLVGASSACALTFLSLSSEAALYSRLGGQAYYDDVLDVTWVADANLAASNSFGLAYNTNLGNHPDDGYGVSYSEVISSDGQTNWGGALHWIDAMNSDGGVGYLGFNDWRLPYTLQPDASCDVQGANGSSGYSCTGSEMGHLYYSALGNIPGSTLNMGPFSNIQQSSAYWSDTEFAPSTDGAWTFLMLDGDQSPHLRSLDFFYAWAVRSGDVSTVPLPAAVYLFGSGLLGFLGVGRKH